MILFLNNTLCTYLSEESRQVIGQVIGLNVVYLMMLIIHVTAHEGTKKCALVLQEGRTLTQFEGLRILSQLLINFQSFGVKLSGI